MNKKYLPILIIGLLVGEFVYGQSYSSSVSIQGTKLIALASKDVQGKLSSGESLTSGCDHGACFFRISFKGRWVGESIGENFDNIRIYEYDFGGDGEKELVVVVDQQHIDNKGSYDRKAVVLSIYHYSGGLIEKIFESEIGMYNTVISKDYVAVYLPSGLESIWHYYKGRFWKMTPVQVRN